MMKWLLASCSVLLIGWCFISSDVKAVQSANPLFTCAQFANRRYQANNAELFEKITLFPQNVIVEQLEGRMGSQYISKVLSGEGVLKQKNTEPLTLQFICLLENDRKPIFFHASPKPDSHSSIDPVKACDVRVEEAAPCLEKQLKREEQKLETLEKQLKGQGSQHAKQLLELSAAQWKQYRDSECLRKSAFHSGGNGAPLAEAACRIRKTRERITDLRVNN